MEGQGWGKGVYPLMTQPQKGRLVTSAPFCRLQGNHKSTWTPEEGMREVPDGGGSRF